LRQFVFIIFILLLGFLIYTQFVQPPSEELLAVKALRKEFDLALNQYMRALKYTSGAGIDLVGDVEMAAARVKKVKREMLELKSRLQDETARQKAAILETRIDNFIKKNDLD
jgi:hypothetical protein